MSIDDYVASKGFGDHQGNAPPPISTASKQQQHGGAGGGMHANNAELDGWTTFWDVANSKYAVSQEKIIHDMAVLTFVASISHGSDWLVSQLLRLCTSTTKKLPELLLGGAGGGGSTGLGTSPMKPRCQCLFA
jgi:hypothetical protein